MHTNEATGIIYIYIYINYYVFIPCKIWIFIQKNNYPHGNDHISPTFCHFWVDDFPANHPFGCKKNPSEILGWTTNLNWWTCRISEPIMQQQTLGTLEFPGKQKSSNSASQNSAQRACRQTMSKGWEHQQRDMEVSGTSRKWKFTLPKFNIASEKLPSQ